MGSGTVTCVFAAILAIVATNASTSGQTPGAAGTRTGDPLKGRTDFAEYQCAYCHGTEGQGGLASVGPRIARVSRSLDSFVAYVRRPTGRMSAYSDKVLSDTELQDIYAYLRSLPDAKPSSDIPLLDQLRKPGRQ